MTVNILNNLLFDGASWMINMSEEKNGRYMKGATKSFLLFISWAGLFFSNLIFAYLYVTASKILTPLPSAAASDATASVSNLLIGVAPLFAAVVAFLFGVFGLRRLENYDTQISDIRKTLAENLAREVKAISEAQKAFQTDLTDRLDTRVDARYEKNDQINSQALNDKTNKAVEKLDLMISKIENELIPFSWLADQEELAADIKDSTVLVSAGRLRDAIDKLVESEEEPLAHSIVSRAIKEGNLNGASSDFFNIAVSLARADFEDLSLRVCDYALTKHPKNVDLLAHAIQMATATSNIPRAEEILASLNDLKRSVWNWRSFQFVCDYLKATGQYDAFFDVCEEWESAIPKDERSYASRVGFLLETGKEDEAIGLVEKCLKSIPAAPQTCVQIGEYLTSVGEPRQALRYLLAGAKGQAVSQPNVNPGGYQFAIAAAYDALAVELYAQSSNSSQPTSSNSRMRQYAEEAQKWYRLAQPISPSAAHLRQSTIRVQLLDSLLGQKGQTLSPALMQMLMDKAREDDDNDVSDT